MFEPTSPCVSIFSKIQDPGGRRLVGEEYNATTYYETGHAGKGGDAGNNRTTGSTGNFYVYNTTAASIVYRSLKITDGLTPGGGGASGIQHGASSLNGGNGGGGLIIIRW